MKSFLLLIILFLLAIVAFLSLHVVSPERSRHAVPDGMHHSAAFSEMQLHARSHKRHQLQASVAGPSVLGVVVASTRRRRRRQRLFEAFVIDNDTYTWREQQFARQCVQPASARVPPRNKKDLRNKQWLLECQQRDFLKLLDVLLDVAPPPRAFYIIEDDTFYCAANFQLFERILDKIPPEPPSNSTDTTTKPVYAITTGIGATGVLLTRSGAEWMRRHYAEHRSKQGLGPDIFLASKPNIDHVYRLKITMNVHVGGHSLLGWDAIDIAVPACFEYACNRGLNDYDYFDFAHCGHYDLYNPRTKCEYARSRVLRSGEFRGTPFSGYPGYICRNRKDAWSYYDVDVLVHKGKVTPRNESVVV